MSREDTLNSYASSSLYLGFLVGFECLLIFPLNHMLDNSIGSSDQRSAVKLLLSISPYILKPFLGLLSDRHYIRGYRFKYYALGSCCLLSLSNATLGLYFRELNSQSITLAGIGGAVGVALADTIGGKETLN